MTTRSEAQRLGLTQYQGKPCLKGHGGVRYTANSTCVECHREHRRVSTKWHQIGDARARLMGYGVIVIELPRHMAVSIKPTKEETPK